MLETPPKPGNCRQRYVAAVCVIAVLLLAVLAATLARRNMGPVYAGKPLRKWILLQRERSALGDEARQVLQSIGPEAVPFLLRLRTEKESLRSQFAKSRFVGRFPFLGQWIPIDQHLKGEAAALLRELGPECIPALTRCYEDGDSEIRIYVIRELARFATESAATAGLLRALNDPADQVKLEAASGLHRQGAQDSTVVPVLVKMLDSGDAHARYVTLYILSRYGPRAEAAIPALTVLLNHTNESVRKSATNTLLKVAPETWP